MNPAITGHTDAGRSLNGSPASIDASSMTQAPSLGEACFPLLRRIVWWLACATVRCSDIGHPFPRASSAPWGYPQGAETRTPAWRERPMCVIARTVRRRGATSGGGVERGVDERVGGRVLGARHGPHAPA